MNMKLITTMILTLFAGGGIAVASERIDSLSYAFGHQYTLATMAGQNDMMQTEYLDRLEVEPECPYRVDWKVTAGAVAELGTPPTEIFNKVMSELKISEDVVSGILMASPLDEDGSLYETVSAAIGKYPLPNGCKWFCGRMDGLQTTIGIMRTEPEFVAEVREASVELDRTSGMLNVQWTFDEPDALKWVEFTEASIGKHVAVEINGKYMFAPRVNQRISGGRCAISVLTPEEINSLFKNAEKTAAQ